MGIYLPNMEMPRDCPMCPLSHWDFAGEFRGCKAVKGKRYAMETEPEYFDSNCRPPWCPLVLVPPHGRLIDSDALIATENQHYALIEDDWYVTVRKVELMPTIIEAEEGEE